MSPADCDHNAFEVKACVKRLTDEAEVVRNYVAEIEIHCTTCGEQFHFVGVGAGFSFTRPTVNLGATMLCVPIAPGLGPLPSRMTYEMPPKTVD